MSKDTISRERLEAPPGTIYAETILEPSHLFMLEHYFSPLASTNKAWTLMLVETGIVDENRGAALLDAILDLEAAGPEAIGDFDQFAQSLVGTTRLNILPVVLEPLQTPSVRHPVHSHHTGAR